MSERPKGSVDPDATVVGPVSDPDATYVGPVGAPDPDATYVGPVAGPEAEAAVTTPSQTLDPDATVAIPPRQPDSGSAIAIPSPGRRRSAFAPALERAAEEVDLNALGGLNAFIGSANPILGAVPQIRQTLRHPNPPALRERLREQIHKFEASAALAGVTEETATVASYALCALLDEAASCTPWGGDWEKNGLLAELHGESRGGQKFFKLLAKAAEDPDANLMLLEVFYACLALGFEGRYRFAQDGKRQLEEVRAKVYELIARERPRPDAELSPHWRGVVTRTRRVPEALAIGGTASAAGLALVALYLSYAFSLGSFSDPVARELAQLKVPAVSAPLAGKPDATTASGAGVAAHLAAEIERGALAVSNDARGSAIVLRTDRMFASGSARLETAVQPLVLRIAEALEGVPGAILVTGHTDDVPIRSARFPSNWELSTERARSVVKLMATRLSDRARLAAEGLADSEPVVPNDSEANRARNRRVVIILRSAR